jgi:hypothetical protein
MSRVEEIEARLADVRGQRAAVEQEWTKERLDRAVADYFASARAHAAGASRLILGGQASGEHVARVLAEDKLDDEGLEGREIGRLQALGFGLLTDRQRDSRLRKLDETIRAAEAELLARRKEAALREIEEEFGGVAA